LTSTDNPANMPEEYIAKQIAKVERCHLEMPLPLISLYQKILQCKKCPTMVKSRQLYRYGRPTFGFGDWRSKILIIAQSPGYKGCGTTGYPFEPYSRTGKLFQEILESAGLSFNSVWTTNLVKCCPEGVNPPTVTAYKNCSYWLDKEISLINPLVIIAVGKPAANYVFDRKLFMTRKCFNIPHPGYPLRKPNLLESYKEEFRNILLKAKSYCSKQSTMEVFL